MNGRSGSISRYTVEDSSRVAAIDLNCSMD